MSNKQFKRLLAFSASQKQSQIHRRQLKSRRSTKNAGNGTGLVLKNSRVQEQVHLETIFISRD